MRKGSLAAAAAAVVLALVPAAAAWPVDGGHGFSLAPYRGSGSWVSIYDRAAWGDPEGVIARLSAHHIHTLYLETSNDRQQVDVVRPEIVGRFLDLAHAEGIDVVGWYLPSLSTPRRDVRRALSGIRFRSASGEQFDAFALDVEATTVRSIAKRTRLATSIVASVRRGAPARYPLGAITIDPAGARYWPGYPFRQLAPNVDVFLPMAYFTARTSGVHNVREYTRRNVELIRELVGDSAFPVHPIGGDTHDAPLREVRAFLTQSALSDSLGASLWEYGRMTPAQWRALSVS
jgi:hypothetical protein